jgi:hypothetical protein
MRSYHCKEFASWVWDEGEHGECEVGGKERLQRECTQGENQSSERVELSMGSLRR